ncbi:metallophosphoesterase family protein [Candidatus Margulisiibacteriota bacterium]
MSKIAFISDLHANIFALKAFLVEIAGAVDKIFCCGDILGYYPYQDETIELLENNGIVSVMGNHDKYAVGLLSPQKPNKMLIKSIEYSHRQLSRKTREYIKGLPDSLEISISETMINLSHGFFEDCEARVTKENLDSFLQGVETAAKALEYNFFGHTHIPFLRKIMDKTYINVGSLGYPRQTRPSYAVLDLSKNVVEICYFNYSTEKMRIDIENRDYEPDYKRMLMRVL